MKSEDYFSDRLRDSVPDSLKDQLPSFDAAKQVHAEFIEWAKAQCERLDITPNEICFGVLPYALEHAPFMIYQMYPAAQAATLAQLLKHHGITEEGTPDHA